MLLLKQTMWSESSLRTAPNWPKNVKNGNDVTIFRHDTNVKIFWLAWFLLSSLVPGPSFMSISLLVLESWHFSFIRDWPEIRQLEVPLPEFSAMSGDWGKLWIPNLARILVNAAKFQGCSSYRFWVIKGKPTGDGGGVKLLPSATQIRVKVI